jgi:hypothetical protein
MIETYEKAKKQIEYTFSNIDLNNINSNLIVVVDAGTNTNGSFRKFSDGTMECWKTVSANNADLTWYTVSVQGGNYYYTFSNWTYPQPFVDGELINLFASGDIGGAGPETHTAFNIDHTKCQYENGIYGLDTRTTGSQSYSLRAIGHWK